MAQGPQISLAYGFNGYVPVFPEPIVTNRNPVNGSDTGIDGQVWVNQSTPTVYIMANMNTSTWVSVSGGTGVFTSLTVTPGPTSLTGALTTISGTNTTNIATDTSTGAVNLGTTGVRTVIVGSNATGAGNTTLRSGTTGATTITGGTGGVSTTTAGQLLLTSTGTTANSISLQAITGAGGATIAGGTGGITMTAVATGTIALSSDTAANTITIGNGGAVKAVTLGSTNTTSSTIIQGGATGSIQLNGSGLVSMAPAVSTGTNPNVTLNARVGRITVTGLTTASAGTQAFVITNSLVVANSGILVTAQNLNASGNGALMTVSGVVPIPNTSFTVTLTNNGGGALGAGDNVIITFWIIS